MHLRRLSLALLASLTVLPAAQAARFTYHGELMDGDAPAHGRYDLEVRAFPTPAGAKALGEAMVLPSVEVKDGRFAVELDLPEDADGMTWVQVGVRTSKSKDDFTALGDRQPISKANSTCPGAWALDGNTGLPAGSFLGIADPTDDTTLELRAGDRPVARFTPINPSDFVDAPQVALGSSANVAAGNGATVAGGGSTHDVGSISCPDCRNAANGNFTTVGGGRGNHASVQFATISGGVNNRSSGQYASVVGGAGNSATGTASTVSGIANLAAGVNATVPGGFGNAAGGTGSFAAGTNARVRLPGPAPGLIPAPLEAADYSGGASDDGSFVWSDNSGGPTARTSGQNQFVIRATGGLRWVGAGAGSTSAPAFVHVVEAFPGPGLNRCSPATDRTVINHPLLNGNPNAVIVVSPTFGLASSGVAPPRNPYGIYYQDVGTGTGCTVGRWVLYDLTASPLPLVTGQRFNIWFVLP